MQPDILATLRYFLHQANLFPLEDVAQEPVLYLKDVAEHFSLPPELVMGDD